jgi:glycosyltransferase domain-containing protein
MSNSFTDNELLLDITLVIPTMNRPYYIDRLLSYYLNMDFVGIILVIDSSDKNNSDYIRERIDSINRNNYKYVYSKGFATTVIKDNLDRIKTKYVSFLGDDDYLIPSALSKSIFFLENNKDISGCRGDGIIVTDSNVSSDDIRMYSRVNRLEEASADRVMQHFLNYGTPFFHVLKLDVFKTAFSLAPSETELNQDYDRLIGEELMASGLMLAYGKFAMIDGLHLVRTNNLERIETRNTWYHVESYNGRKKAVYNFIKKISTIVSERDSITLFEAERIITKVQKTSVFNKRNNNVFIANFRKFIKPLLISINVWKFISVYIRKYSEFKRYVYMVLFVDKKDRVTLKNLLNPDNRYHKDFIPVYLSLIGYKFQETRLRSKR